MSKENADTLEVYDKFAQTYLDNSAVHDNLDKDKARRKRAKLNALLKKSFCDLPKGSDIFEIGSGDGTNSWYLKGLGYDVTASDVAPTFIDASKKQGLNAIKFNALEDDFTKNYSGIFAWRVFVHFTKDDAQKVLDKSYKALRPGGRFVFNAINRDYKGVDEEWADFPNEYHMGADSYYSYFKEDELREMIGKTDFKIVDFFKEGGENNDKWLVFVLENPGL